MSRATPRLLEFARRLIAHEAVVAKPSAGSASTSFPVYERLHPHLAALIGQGGFRALLWRSRALAIAELPWLSSVHVKEDGSLEAGEEPDSRLHPEKLVEGRVVLLAQLLGLLEAFIGENLTTILVREVWPEISLDGLDSREGAVHEKAN